MYAIVRAGATQQKVAVGDVIEIDKVSTAVGDTLTLPVVMTVDGESVTVTGLDKAKRLADVFDVVIDAPIGGMLRGITRDGERPGYIVTVADDRARAVAAADRAEQTVTFHIDT